VLWDEIQGVLDILNFARMSTDEMETEVGRGVRHWEKVWRFSILSEFLTTLEAFNHKKEQGQNKVVLAMSASYAYHITSCLLCLSVSSPFLCSFLCLFLT
jgi:hypothetical protein